MTNELSVEEAVELLKEKRIEINYQVNGTTRFSKALEMGIKALEQQPCEDAISREDALKAIEEQKKGFYGVERYAIDECHSAVMKLPSVRPYKEIVEDKRACEKCIHYVTRDSRGVVLCGCDSWECDFEEVKT